MGAGGLDRKAVKNCKLNQVKYSGGLKLVLDAAFFIRHILKIMASRSTRKTLFDILKWIIIAVILYFIIRQVITQWEQVKNYHWQIDWLFLVLSLFMLAGGLFFKSFLWSEVLKSFDTYLPPLRAFRVAYLSNLGRYVPGKIVQFVGIIYLAKKEGVREDVALASFALIQMFDIPSGLILIVTYLLIMGISFSTFSAYSSVLIAVGIVSLASLVIILTPSFLSKTLNFGLRLLKQPAINFSLQKKTGFKILFLYFVAWNIMGAAFYFFLRAVTSIPDNFFGQACVIFSASYLIGYLALFAPGGIGVREGVMGLLLAQIGGLATPVALAVGLAARLWFLVAELSVSVMALLVGSKK